jgi:murein DD-endopeptidase MepM/ murein hydrolase activator NlpD
MKNFYTLTVLLFFCSLSLENFSQNTITSNHQYGEDYFIDRNSSSNPTDEQYAEIEKRCAENVKLFGLDKTEKSTTQVSLNWPLKEAAGFNDCSYYVISAYADHNPTSGVYQDYNGGTNCYDGHRGTDIATYPFHFYKMDHDQVEVIAAAAGTIIDKHDGEFDRNCASNSMTANYVIIQHADGSRILYWHMKNGKVTTKLIGQTVAVGEYLGVVGSSGSSSGPHLHFEVWSGSTVSTLVDPFAGPNNTWNATSWWAIQKPNTEPAIIKASVHTTDADFASCPTTETPNESTSYTIPFQGPGLAAGYAKFYVFLRNVTSGTNVDMSIHNPDGSVYAATGNPWSYTYASSSLFSSLAYSKKLPTTAGTYTFEATYNGVTCSQSFDILMATDINDLNNLSEIHLFPNPANSIVSIDIPEAISESATILEILDINGKLLKSIPVQDIHTEISVSDLTSGVYVFKLSNKETVIMKKVVKE